MKCYSYPKDNDICQHLLVFIKQLSHFFIHNFAIEIPHITLIVNLYKCA